MLQYLSLPNSGCKWQHLISHMTLGGKWQCCCKPLLTAYEGNLFASESRRQKHTCAAALQQYKTGKISKTFEIPPTTERFSKWPVLLKWQTVHVSWAQCEIQISSAPCSNLSPIPSGQVRAHSLAVLLPSNSLFFWHYYCVGWVQWHQNLLSLCFEFEIYFPLSWASSCSAGFTARSLFPTGDGPVKQKC